jgi:hypothetical protein
MAVVWKQIRMLVVNRVSSTQLPSYCTKWPMPVMPTKAGDGSLPMYDVPNKKKEKKKNPIFGIHAWAVS